VFEVDVDKAPEDQPDPIVNRWHPDVSPAASVEPGDTFRVEQLDWTGNQVNNDDSANDIRDMDLDPNHHLSGPIEVKGAEPGDMLVVDILDLGPFQDNEWGFTGIFDQDNGGGFLTDHFPEAFSGLVYCWTQLIYVISHYTTPYRDHDSIPQKCTWRSFVH
jgi:formamidase